MKIRSAFFNEAGRKSRNQDSILPPIQEGSDYWAAIADGMGGQPGGDIASQRAIEVVAKEVSTDSAVQIPALFAQVQNRLKEISRTFPQYENMGTTLTILKLTDKIARVGHVGDTRLYHLRAGGLVDRTIDQTEVQELINRGVLNKASARKYPRRNILLSVLSPKRSYNLYEQTFDLLSGDRLVLLSDGVSGVVFRREIQAISLASKMAHDFCLNVRREVMQRGVIDDYSAICIDIL